MHHGVPLIINAMQRFPLHRALQTTACFALGSSLMRDGILFLGGRGDLFLTETYPHLSRSRKLRNPYDTLGHDQLEDSLRQTLLDLGGINVILSAMARKYPPSTKSSSNSIKKGAPFNWNLK